MRDQWFYVQMGRQYGPVDTAELRRFVSTGQLHPTDLVWQYGLANWTPIGLLDGLIVPPRIPPAPTYVAPRYRGATEPADVNRIACGVFAIVLGFIGVHKFMLGRTFEGLAMLLGTVLTFGLGAMVFAPIGLVEGILYLTKSDYEFHRIYVIGRRGWF